MNIKLEELTEDITRAVRQALAEDVGTGDITAELIPATQHNRAEIITRDDCTLSGSAWLEETYRQLGGLTNIEWHRHDSEQVPSGSKLVSLEGNTRTLLTGERCALNFIQLLSGTATSAREFAELAGNSKVKILDTRKTIPGLRLAQKYAVGCGGCDNHRLGLYDAFLIKENHITACGSISNAIEKARSLYPDKTVEIEIESVPELTEAIACGADIIMLDNFSDEELAQAQTLDKGKSLLEVSGGIEKSQFKENSAQAFDRISIGALTKHVRAIDLSMRIVG